jgi:hypothetical protein
VTIQGFELQISLTLLQVADDGANDFVDLVKNTHDVVNSGVRSVDENPVGQPELPEAVEALHRRGMKDL